MPYTVANPHPPDPVPFTSATSRAAHKEQRRQKTTYTSSLSIAGCGPLLGWYLYDGERVATVEGGD